jgi:hypothetical protein
MGIERTNDDLERLVHSDATNLGDILKVHPYTQIDRTENEGLFNRLRGIKPTKIVGIDISDEDLEGKNVLRHTAMLLLLEDNVQAGDVEIYKSKIIFRDSNMRSRFIHRIPKMVHVVE